MRAILKEDDDDKDNATWEYSTNNSTNWKPFSPECIKEIESLYKQGKT
jgi:hypothetical protein